MQIQADHTLDARGLRVYPGLIALGAVLRFGPRPPVERPPSGLDRLNGFLWTGRGHAAHDPCPPHLEPVSTRQHPLAALTVCGAQDRVLLLLIQEENADVVKTESLADDLGQLRKQHILVLDRCGCSCHLSNGFELAGAARVAGVREGQFGGAAGHVIF